MKRMLVICPYPFDKAPSQRLKYEQYFPYFREDGFEVTVKPFMSERFWSIAYKPGNILEKAFQLMKAYIRRLALLFSIRRYDIVYIHLWVTPFGAPVFEKLVTTLARTVVYDIDDLVYLGSSKSDPWYTRLLKGRSKPITLMKKADHVITCTPYLDSFVRKFNQSTTDISSTIDTQSYRPVNRYANDTQLVLGWSGSFSTIRYLRLLEPVLRQLRSKVDFRLLVMGASNFSIEGVEVESVAWSREKELPTLRRFDIGLYPLPLDEEWVYGKSGLKALQYMALGIPTIATAIGTNFRIINDDVDGFLVSSPDEWLQKIVLLAGDADMRRRIGMRAATKVEQQYSVNANKATYVNILNSVLKKSAADA